MAKLGLWVLVAALGAALGFGFLWLTLPLLGLSPSLLLSSYVNPDTADSRAYLAQAHIAAAAVLVQIIGGALLLLGLYYTARTLRLNQEGQITERYTRAIDQLGSEKLQVCLGGIYALERIAWDSARDHYTIMEVLTAYVRESAPWPRRAGERSSTSSRPPQDIQAVLTVIGRRNLSHEKGQGTRTWRILNLAHTDLREAMLDGAHLELANLVGANLEGATLTQAHLQGANLAKANLARTQLLGTNLKGAQLHSATLQDAFAVQANFSGARFIVANLERAYFRSVDFSCMKNWSFDASLPKNSNCVDMTQVSIKGCTFEAVDLRQVEGLTQEKIVEATLGPGVQLPNGLRATRSF